MADLEVGDSQLNVKNFERINADVNHLVQRQNSAKRAIDNTNAQIEIKGPSVVLEKESKYWAKTKRSICMRTDLAVSVVGSSVKDLTELSRDPPSVMAIKDLLDSIEEFTNETSMEILKAALVVVRTGNESTCNEVLEDLKMAFESLSEEHLPRTTEILQKTQLAIRDLAMDPFDRDSDRSARLRAHREKQRASTSAGSSPATQTLRGASHVEGSEHSNQGTQASQDPAQILDAPSFHRYINSVLPLVPIERMVEAVQDVVMEFAPSHESLNKHGSGKAKEVTSGWKKEMNDLGARVQALEEVIRSRYSVGADKKVKEEEKSLQTEASPHPPKEPSPGSEHKKGVKRSRS